MKRIRHRCRRQLLDRCLPVFVLFMSLLTGMPAWAQSMPGTPLAAPSPGMAPSAKNWIWILLSLLLFATVMLVSLRPGKRSHQD